MFHFVFNMFSDSLNQEIMHFEKEVSLATYTVYISLAFS